MFRRSCRFLLCLFVICCRIADAQTDQQGEAHFFETQIRPLLAEHCFPCHSDKKQQGDLRLDRRQFVFQEGSAGRPVIPGNPEESRLWQVVKYDDFDVQMPPSGKLAEAQLNQLKHWINSGAYWPAESETAELAPTSGIPVTAQGKIDFQKARETHWAYQPVQPPRIPDVDPSLEVTSTIDRFIVSKLNEKNLTLSTQASRQKLIRRLSFDLRGLPPNYDEVQEFVRDESPQAFELLVDRYLSDPGYGERWGRYWLDVARYADTKGYVFTENRFYPYSFTYRDYVIDAFNTDKPYDTFLMEQLAADQLSLNENDPRLAAMGFLTVGPRFLNNTANVIDDRIDVVMRGLMGLTVGCARCHDHKFDPVPTEDYYSLYGIFESCYEPELPPLRGEPDTSAPGYQEFTTELKKREQAVSDYLINTHQELLAKARNELDDYFPAAMKAMKFLPEDSAWKPKHGEPRARLMDLWERILQVRLNRSDPIFIPGIRFTEAIKAGETSAAQIDTLLSELEQDETIPNLIREAFRQARPVTQLEIVNVYVEILSKVRDEWEEFHKQHPLADQFDDSGKEAVRGILFGANSISDVDPGDFSPLFERDNRDEMRKLQRMVDEWHVTSPDAPPRSMVLLDKANLVEPVVFVRGNPGRRGARVPRRGPQLFSSISDDIFEETSGRRELAEMIVSSSNPLTARVFVNRVWMYHFGTPLVSTPSDYGLQIPEPVHRELLDYLAWSFVHQHNWSIKSLHMEILMSKTWQQQSLDRIDARKIDPENQLYWKQNRQRLDFEAMRDSMLAVSGQLDSSLGGRPVDIEQAPFSDRRTVYALIDRNNPSGLFRTFDFPTPNSSSPARSETTVPQQALFGMNSTFSKNIANSLAARVQQDHKTSETQVAALVENVLSRSIDDSEQNLLMNYLKHHSLDELAQGLLLSNEFFFVD